MVNEAYQQREPVFYALRDNHLDLCRLWTEDVWERSREIRYSWSLRTCPGVVIQWLPWPFPRETASDLTCFMWRLFAGISYMDFACLLTSVVIIIDGFIDPQLDFGKFIDYIVFLYYLEHNEETLTTAQETLHLKCFRMDDSWGPRLSNDNGAKAGGSLTSRDVGLPGARGAPGVFPDGWSAFRPVRTLVKFCCLLEPLLALL